MSIKENISLMESAEDRAPQIEGGNESTPLTTTDSSEMIKNIDKTSEKSSSLKKESTSLSSVDITKTASEDEKQDVMLSERSSEEMTEHFSRKEKEIQDAERVSSISNSFDDLKERLQGKKDVVMLEENSSQEMELKKSNSTESLEELSDIHSELQKIEDQVTRSTLVFDDIQGKRLLVKTLEDKLADSLSKQVRYKKEIEQLTNLLQFGSAQDKKVAKEEQSSIDDKKQLKSKLPSENTSLLLNSQLDVLKQERRVLQDTLLSTYLSQIRQALYSWMVKYHDMEQKLSQQDNDIKQLKDQLFLKAEENAIITNLLAERQADAIEKENKTIQELESSAIVSMKEQNMELLEQVKELKKEKDKQLQLASSMQIHFEIMQNDLQAHLEQMTLKSDQWKCQYEAIVNSHEQLKIAYQEMYVTNTKHKEIMIEKVNSWKECHKTLKKALKNLQRKLEFYNTIIPQEIIQEKNALWNDLEKDQEVDIEQDQDFQFLDSGIDMLDLTAVIGYMTTSHTEYRSPILTIAEIPGPT